VLQPGDFASREHLERTVMDFIDYHNQHDARPYRWTYTGQPREVTTNTTPDHTAGPIPASHEKSNCTSLFKTLH